MSEHLSHENKKCSQCSQCSQGDGETASGYLKMDRKSIGASNNATICISPSNNGAQFSQNTLGLATLATLATNPISRPSYLSSERGGVGYTVATPGYTFPPPVQYCSEGQHIWFPRCEGDGGMLQCAKCPEVHVAKAADSQRSPAVHDPQCDGRGLVVVPGFGWSCPQCNGRYVVPEAPA